jgi:hypothetical protein
MLGSLTSLLSSLFWTLVLIFCFLVALNLRNPVPVPSSPWLVPSLALPPDEDDPDADEKLN